jgi:hypothetical protein
VEYIKIPALNTYYRCSKICLFPKAYCDIMVSLFEHSPVYVRQQFNFKHFTGTVKGHVYIKQYFQNDCQFAVYAYAY